MYIKLFAKMPLQVGHRHSSGRFKFTLAGWALGIVIPWTSRRGRLWRLLKSFYKIATCEGFRLTWFLAGIGGILFEKWVCASPAR